MGPPGRPLLPGLVIYAHTDGSFSFWDPARNYWKRGGDADISERRPAQVFTQDEVWNGAYVQENGRRVPICNGLIIDWAAWISAQNESHTTMKAVIDALASDGNDVRVEPSRLSRISIDDPRDIPTLRTGYGETIPILHASAGIRRIVALAYVLTLAWREHRLAAEQLGEGPCESVVLLIDEVESHLHPRWQRSILNSLRGAVRALGTPTAVQMVVSTHSPLVLSSAEAWFDDERDAWFDLDLESESGVVLRRRTYERRGAVGHWLTSEAFDLVTDRGSVEAERVVLRARALFGGEQPSLDEVEEVGRNSARCSPMPIPFSQDGGTSENFCGPNELPGRNDQGCATAGTERFRPQGSPTGFVGHRGVGWHTIAAHAWPPVRPARVNTDSDSRERVPRPHGTHVEKLANGLRVLRQHRILRIADDLFPFVAKEIRRLGL